MKKPKCKLVGIDGNAFAIIGKVTKTLKNAGMADRVPEFQRRAISGDYNKLLAVCFEYVDVTSDEEE